MIQGLQCLPWLKAQERDGDLAIANCEKCMQATSKEQRQYLGCPFEAPIENAQPWSPPDGKHGFKHASPTVCPGYTTSLPEVRETSRAYTHWTKGQLAEFCGGQPSDAMLMAVEILDFDVHANQHYLMTPVNEGGGRK